MNSLSDGSVLDIDEGYLEPTMTEEGVVQCVFSSMDKLKVGTGTTTRQHITKIYWFVEEVGNEKFSLRRINSHHVPAGEAKTVNLTTLLSKYLPEIEFWEEKTVPAMRQLETYLEDGEAEREDGRFYSAEKSFNKALGIDEQNVRALFNLGLVYLELDALDKARDMMHELLKLNTSFAGKDQHLFNDFGISLRKSGLYDEAVEYYQHALKYVKDDEHLYFNLSRSHYERGDWTECARALAWCKRLNPGLPAAQDLTDLIMELSNNPRLCRQYGKPPISNDEAAGILGILNSATPFKADQGDVLEPESGHVRSRGVFEEEEELIDDILDEDDLI